MYDINIFLIQEREYILIQMRHYTNKSDQVGLHNVQNNYPIATEKRCLLF